MTSTEAEYILGELIAGVPPRHPNALEPDDLIELANERLRGLIPDEKLYQNHWHLHGALNLMPGYAGLPCPLTPDNAAPYVAWLVGRKLPPNSTIVTRKDAP